MKKTDLIIPQQPPFRFVDALVQWDDQGAETLFEVRNDCLLLDENGHLTSAGLMEAAAQSCAAWQSELSRYNNDTDVHIGMIGAVPLMEITRLPAVGEIINIKLQEKIRVFNTLLIEADASINGNIIAHIELKVVILE